jgi:hypothetical protein
MIKKLNIVGGILVILIITFFISKGFLEQSNLNVDGRYTVAVTTGQTAASRGPWISFVFVVNGTEYKGEQRSLKYRPEIQHGRYYLKFLPSDPSIYEIYWDKPVPKSIVVTPFEGWSKIP